MPVRRNPVFLQRILHSVQNTGYKHQDYLQGIRNPADLLSDMSRNQIPSSSEMVGAASVPCSQTRNQNSRLMESLTASRKRTDLPTYFRPAWPQLMVNIIQPLFMPYTCGQKPGKGTYRCTKDHEIIHLDQDTDVLPPCPKCNSCSWEKIY